MNSNFLKININKPLHFISAGNFMPSNENWIHPKRNIDHFVLLLVLDDILQIQQENDPYQVSENSTLLLLPNQTHRGIGKSNKNLSYYWCHFNIDSEYSQINEQDFYSELIQLKFDPYYNNICIPIFHQFDNTNRIKILFNQLLHTANHNYYSRYKANYLLTSLIMEISEQYLDKLNDEPANRYENARFIQMLEWIRINISNDISVSQIAQNFSYNPDYFSKLFKIKTGINFTDYVTDLKLTRIKDLLINTKLSVKEIAYSIGFKDEKYLMKLFKKHEKLTPTQYRNAYCSTHMNNQ